MNGYFITFFIVNPFGFTCASFLGSTLAGTAVDFLPTFYQQSLLGSTQNYFFLSFSTASR